MPAPQHVDDKLYDNILLLFPDGFHRSVVLCRFLFALYVRLKVVQPSKNQHFFICCFTKSYLCHLK